MSKKLTGVESGINREVFPKATVAENIIKICPSSIMFGLKKLFSNVLALYCSLDVIVAVHVDTKKLQRPLKSKSFAAKYYY